MAGRRQHEADFLDLYVEITEKHGAGERLLAPRPRERDAQASAICPVLSHLIYDPVSRGALSSSAAIASGFRLDGWNP